MARILVVLMLSAAASQVRAQECVTVKLPNGAMTTECPSTMPPIPPAGPVGARRDATGGSSMPPVPGSIPPPPPLLRYVCQTPAGECGLPVSPFAVRGGVCSCGGVNGVVD